MTSPIASPWNVTVFPFQKRPLDTSPGTTCLPTSSALSGLFGGRGASEAQAGATADTAAMSAAAAAMVASLRILLAPNDGPRVTAEREDAHELEPAQPHRE